jgi:hypothetical protein
MAGTRETFFGGRAVADDPGDFTVRDALYMCRDNACAYAEVAQVTPDVEACLATQQDLNPGTDERVCGLAAQAMLGYKDMEIK